MSDNAANTPKLRNARACEACRAAKSRCIYKSQIGVCQRCEQSGSQCVVRTKARPMRARAARPTSGSNQIFAESEFSMNLPTVQTPDTRKDVIALHDHHKEFFAAEETPEVRRLKPTEDGQPDTQCHPEIIEQRTVTRPQAEELLKIYRARSAFFPFVYIPETATVSSLARTSPFLLLAILTSASIRDPPLYHQLDHEFRRILSGKIIVEGKKSLDFLQGLLVYVGWYPVHVNPRNNQSFMYLNLAISLIVDLGLDQEYPNPNNFSAINTEGLMDGEYFTTAAKRAYLGCYYLSSALSMGFQKPNNLHYRNLMDTHGQTLMRDEHSTEIYSLIKLQHLAERISTLFRTERPSSNLGMDNLNDEVNRQIFQNELNEWENSTDERMRKLPNFKLATLFIQTTIYSYPLGLLKRPYRKQLATFSTSPPPSPTHLHNCLQAAKAFFEYLLSLPSSTYLSFTTIHFGYLVHILLILSRLTFILSPLSFWTPTQTRSQIPLSMYLDALCYRFQDLSSTYSKDGEPPRNPDVWYVFKMVLGSVKSSWEGRVDRIQGGAVGDGEGENTENVPGEGKDDNAQEGMNLHIPSIRGHCPILHDKSLDIYWEKAIDSTYGGSPLDYSPANGSGSTSSGENQGQAGRFGYYDLWATMTGSWVEEF